MPYVSLARPPAERLHLEKTFGIRLDEEDTQKLWQLCRLSKLTASEVMRALLRQAELAHVYPVRLPPAPGAEARA